MLYPLSYEGAGRSAAGVPERTSAYLEQAEPA
jgi:hypothetical protein